MLTESALDPSTAIYNATVLAGDPWIQEIRKGQTLRILDLEGNQAADTLFYNAHDYEDRYSAQDTIRDQGNIYLTTGTKLRSLKGHTLLTIVADTCGRHDTLGGACSAESNTVRYGDHTKYMHSCRDNFLLAIASSDFGLEKRDLTSNINFEDNLLNVLLTSQLPWESGRNEPGGR